MIKNNWTFNCPKCKRPFIMHEKDYNNIPDLISEEIECPGIEAVNDYKARPCGNKFRVVKSMLWNNWDRSWPQMEAFVQGLIRGGE